MTKENKVELPNIKLVDQSVLIRIKPECPLAHIDIAEINYKNISLLEKFITERGKILSSRLTNVSAKKQRAIAKAIKLARKLSLISPISNRSSCKTKINN